MTQSQQQWMYHWLRAELVNATYHTTKMCMEVPMSDAERRIYGTDAKRALHQLIEIAAQTIALIGEGVAACNAPVELPEESADESTAQANRTILV